MIDISALNALILFSEIDDSWAPSDQNRKRPAFLRLLALSLAKEHMMKRTNIPKQNFSAELLAEVRASTTDPVASTSDTRNPPARKRGICGCCKSKCDSKCVICSKFICKLSRKIVCTSCIEANK